jgi:hypothetical protein
MARGGGMTQLERELQRLCGAEYFISKTTANKCFRASNVATDTARSDRRPFEKQRGVWMSGENVASLS